MEDVLLILSAAPIALSVVALLTSLLGVARRARADSEFVNELSKSIAQLKESIAAQKSEFERVQSQLYVEMKEVDARNRSQGSVNKSISQGSVNKNILIKGNSSEMYHIYFSGVKGRGENKELPDYVKEALYKLDKRDKKHIVKALNQPSVKGRMRYFDKVFKMASQLI